MKNFLYVTLILLLVLLVFLGYKLHSDSEGYDKDMREKENICSTNEKKKIDLDCTSNIN